MATDDFMRAPAYPSAFAQVQAIESVILKAFQQSPTMRRAVYDVVESKLEELEGRIKKIASSALDLSEARIGQVSRKQAALDEALERHHKLVRTMGKLRRKNARLLEAVLWALGESDTFTPRAEGDGQYWWRKELRRRAGLTK